MEGLGDLYSAGMPRVGRGSPRESQRRNVPGVRTDNSGVPLSLGHGRWGSPRGGDMSSWRTLLLQCSLCIHVPFLLQFGF